MSFVPTTKLDHFIAGEVSLLLADGEGVEAAGYFDTMNGGYSGGGIVGGVAAFADVLSSAGYHTILTDRRLILLQCRLGAFAPLMENNGVTEIPLEQVQAAVFQTSNFRNKRQRLHMKMTDAAFNFRCADSNKHVSSQKALLDILEERFRPSV